MHKENVLLVPLWFERTLHFKEQDHPKNSQNPQSSFFFPFAL